MFGRYRRMVPWAHRRLIREHGLAKPNWFVGSAESHGLYMDAQMQRDIDSIKAKITARHESAASPRKDPNDG